MRAGVLFRRSAKGLAEHYLGINEHVFSSAHSIRQFEEERFKNKVNAALGKALPKRLNESSQELLEILLEHPRVQALVQNSVHGEEHGKKVLLEEIQKAVKRKQQKPSAQN